MDEENLIDGAPQRRHGKRRRVAFRLLAVVAVCAVWWFAFTRGRVSTATDSVCRVEVRAWYNVVLPDGDTLRLSPETGRVLTDEAAFFRADTAVVSGSFVSARGHLVTSSAAVCGAPMMLAADSLKALLQSEKSRLEARSKVLAEADRELDYYARTHSVTDDGYNDVMAYRAANEARAALTDSALKIVETAASQEGLKASLHVEAVADVGQLDDSLHAEVGRYDLHLLKRADGLLLFQTASEKLPARSHYFSLSALSPAGSASLVIACFDGEAVADAAPTDVAQRLNDAHSEGGAVTDDEGRLCGLRVDGATVDVSALRRLCQASEGGFKWWLGETWAVTKCVVLPPSDETTLQALAGTVVERNLKGLRHAGDTFIYIRSDAGYYAGRVAAGQPHGFGAMAYADGRSYRGHFDKGRRAGQGVLVDSLGTTHYAGTWAADTLAVGEVTDSLGRYCGELNAALQPTGVGAWTGCDGAYYAGEWSDGRRHGFGFAVGEKPIVQAGVWKRGTFRGEQMIYTADRVYGIDISRYQHEIGRRRYAIDWSSLRITRLGAAGAARIRGSQDYPVSFVYIKSTQGTTIRSRYYAADAAACRRRGIPVGAYHFFSTKRGGREQAVYFIKHTAIKNGDLPPVLDVEPYDSQVKAMGGRDAMFREIVAWVRYVRAVCGTSPVLYVSQSFVNKYMAAAPAALHDCPVWIARYGEYKPYVQLFLWQLSPRGRVAGIRGAVDINVFNGTRDQFREFRQEHGVRR